MKKKLGAAPVKAEFSLGRVYTPDAIAAALWQHLEEKYNIADMRVLEPSVGDGAFVKYVIDNCDSVLSIDCIDIDQKTVDELSKSVYTDNIKFYASDFLDFYQNCQRSGKVYDLIIGNPPYIRKRDYSSDFREKIVSLQKNGAVSVESCQNSWAIFSELCVELLSERGILAFVIPYELLNVNYGKRLLKCLAKQFQTIEVYVSAGRAFKELDQDAVILVCSRIHDGSSGVVIKRVDSFTQLSSKQTSRLPENFNDFHIGSWMLNDEEKASLMEVLENFKPLSYYLQSTPGIVTGANNYFIVNRRQSEELGSESFVPIISRTAQLPNSPGFSLRDAEALQEKYSAYLLQIKPNYGISEALQAYLEFGERQGINDRYKCKKRDVWYCLSEPKIFEAFCFKRAHSYLRFCVNEAKIATTDSAYGIIAHSNASARGVVFSFYNVVTMAMTELLGRFYGGGVLEVTPKEFKSVPVLYVEPSDDQYNEFEKIYSSSSGGIDEILTFSDKWLLSNLYINQYQLSIIHGIYNKLRDHRLRHSK